MEIKELIENKCIRVDWKNSITDTFYTMKKSWEDFSYIFEDKDFLNLIENYNSETVIDYLLAIGQEFTRFDFILYNLNEDADSYCLILIKTEESEKFVEQAKNSNLRLERQKQPRKKHGAKATRIKLSQQLSHEKTILKGRYSLQWPISVTAQRFYNDGAFSHESTSIVDFRKWPPTTQITEKITHIASNSRNDIWAAIFSNPKNKQSKLKVSDNPLNPDNWKAIEFDGELHLLSSLFWIGDDLLVIREKDVWLLDSVSNINTKCTLLFKSKDHPDSIHDAFPELFRTKNQNHYILLYTQFYEWKNRKLIPTGIYAEKHSQFEAFPTGNNRIVYSSKSRLIEVDFKTKKTRHRKLVNMDDRARIQKLDDDWAIILRIAYTNKDIPIAQLWNSNQDIWKEIKLGAFGKLGIQDLIKTPNEILIQADDDHTLIKLSDLEEVLSTSKYDVENPNCWNENWAPEKDLNQTPWYKKVLRG
jgi:hypothetical protein